MELLPKSGGHGDRNLTSSQVVSESESPSPTFIQTDSPNQTPKTLIQIQSDSPNQTSNHTLIQITDIEIPNNDTKPVLQIEGGTGAWFVG